MPLQLLTPHFKQRMKHDEPWLRPYGSENDSHADPAETRKLLLAAEIEILTLRSRILFSESRIAIFRGFWTLAVIGLSYAMFRWTNSLPSIVAMGLATLVLYAEAITTIRRRMLQRRTNEERTGYEQLYRLFAVNPMHRDGVTFPLSQK